MIARIGVASLREKYEVLSAELDERARRLWAATEAAALGYGGITAVAAATGIAVSTIRAGLRELRQNLEKPSSLERRVRKPGAGRKPLDQVDPALDAALNALIEPTTRGDPMSPLRWTCKSTRVLAAELSREGHKVSHMSVDRLLHQRGYSLQADRKTKEGTSHPDRDAQFTHISNQAQAFQARGQPVVSVDTKKKELVGDFKNGGREWQPAGEPIKVRVHDFQDPELGKAIPYGVYDVAQNSGWVSVGMDHDTAEFAVQTIRQWWYQMGQPVYPAASELLITADGGGSNGSRVRLWKIALQRLADETGLRISVCHLPPGTSKWNKIEHRMFCHITRNWRGRPLESREVVVNLIAGTTTKKGLQIQAALDANQYPKGIKVADSELADVRIEKDNFHGEWNYAISPR
jgi:transposase